MKKLISNTADTFGSRDYKVNQQLTEEHKKFMSLKSDNDIAKLYGASFLGSDSISNAKLKLEDYNEAGLGRTTSTLASELDKTPTLNKIRKGQEERELKRSRNQRQVKFNKLNPTRLNWLFSKIYKRPLLRLSDGAKIPGEGYKDEVPALLTKGETVIDKDTSKKLGIHTQKDYKRFQKLQERVTYLILQMVE